MTREELIKAIKCYNELIEKARTQGEQPCVRYVIRVKTLSFLLSQEPDLEVKKGVGDAI